MDLILVDCEEDILTYLASVDGEAFLAGQLVMFGAAVDRPAGPEVVRLASAWIAGQTGPSEGYQIAAEGQPAGDN